MSDLPVDPRRMSRQFPALTDADLEAYVTVTRRILENKGPAERGKVTRDIIEMARTARAKSSAGSQLTDGRDSPGYLEPSRRCRGPRSRGRRTAGSA
jgi:hypothetical protein